MKDDITDFMWAATCIGMAFWGLLGLGVLILCAIWVVLNWKLALMMLLMTIAWAALMIAKQHYNWRF